MGREYWDYTKWQDDRDEWNHKLWEMDQKLKEEENKVKEEKVKKGELKSPKFYEIPTGNGLAQLSIFPQVPKASVKSPKKAEKEQTSSQEKIEDEDENDIQ